MDKRRPILALVLALGMLGCGGDDGTGHPADDPELVQQAQVKIERAAAAVLDQTRSRYLPGEKRLGVLCLSPEEARLKKVGPEFIQCQVEASSTPSRKRPETVYIEEEAWRVPVASDRTLGEPVIAEGYRIRDFLLNDNRLGCSVGRTPQVRCRMPAAVPPPAPGG
jgi:hypothetical protein